MRRPLRHGWSATDSLPIALPPLLCTSPACSSRRWTFCDPDASRFGRLRLPRSKQGAGKTGKHHDMRDGTGSAVNGDQIHNSYQRNPD
eukprot:COSAG02_NODE_1090_length_14647_cov_122.569425_17_plen_88_part_00